MVRGTHTRGGVRKSSAAKATLRKSAANSIAGLEQKPASQAQLDAALASRPKVDFLDPFMRHAAMQAKGISLCAFLITLAAFQRGLKVTFHYERSSYDIRFANSKIQGHRGELFSISNASKTHVFSRTLGDLTDPAASSIVDDKHLTKAHLRRVGLKAPDGIVVDKSQLALINKFIARNSNKRFVVKPVDGSLAKGVEADIQADALIEALKSQADSRVIIEEHVVGTEYRVTVVGGRCVAVSERISPYIVGDGRSSIKQLIAALNEQGDAHPYWSGIHDETIVEAFLMRQSLSYNTILEAGARTFLSNTSYGVQHRDVTAASQEALKYAAVKAAEALQLVNCGIDIIVTPSGEPVILELNQRSYIGMHSFPLHGTGQGNAVAEAIVDHYFPETIRKKTHSKLAYDFEPVRMALMSKQFGDISLPVIGEDWHVIRLSETGVSAQLMVKLFERAASMSGVFLMSAPHVKCGVDICFACAPSNLQAFLRVIPIQFRESLRQKIISMIS